MVPSGQASIAGRKRTGAKAIIRAPRLAANKKSLERQLPAIMIHEMSRRDLIALYAAAARRLAEEPSLRSFVRIASSMRESVLSHSSALASAVLARNSS